MPITPRLFEALTRFSQDVLVLVSAEGRLLYVSAAYTRVLGYTPEEQLTQPSVFAFVHPEDRPRAEAAFVALLGRPGGAAAATVRARHKEGTWRWLEVTGTNLLHEPEVRAIVAHFHDVTDRVAQDAARTRQARVEGALLVARTAAHQVLNALQPVTSYAERLAADPAVRADPRLASYAQSIVDGTLDTAHRVQQLQALVRVVEDTTLLGPDYPLLDVERSAAPD